MARTLEKSDAQELDTSEGKWLTCDANLKEEKTRRMATDLAAEYKELEPRAQAFGSELHRQIESLLGQNELRLAIPIERRIKSWASISEKVDRKAVNINSCRDISDLIGLRIILLFRRDALRTCELIEKHFTVHEHEDKSKVLEDSRFGYASFHYLVSAPETWRAVPTLSTLQDWRAEIQVRTLAQHIWATTSHTLQYKKEQDVPATIRRTINRAAAILETVDLEFERALDERENYLKAQHAESEADTLNVDLIARLLGDIFPPENKMDEEKYSQLIDELRFFGINSLSAFRSLLQRHLNSVLEEEHVRVEQEKNREQPVGVTPERLAEGIFYNHVGLARRALNQEFGERYQVFQAQQAQTPRANSEE
jgi:ppGpp synthetase/RelA/SpoT-type nucleotidyltranferase